MRDRLERLARDLWWTGQPAAHALWRDLDPDLWEAVNHNPLALVREARLDVYPPGWEDRASALLHAWERFHDTDPGYATPKVAYFSMEFGLHECLPVYSGGLGILAGDHLRSASDIGVDMVAVGLFWSEGYFKQVVHDGRQVPAYAPNQPGRLPMQPVLASESVRGRQRDRDRRAQARPLEIRIPHGHHSYAARAWKVQVGRATLYLLDADFEGNPSEVRWLTRRLYGGDHHARLRQEVLLGIGGVRLLAALGIRPDVLHLNEGHAAFATFELWGKGLQEGRSPDESWEAVRRMCVFTTHTPVPAGHDRFGWDDINPVLGGYRAQMGLWPGAFMDKGRVHPGDIHEPLCMTVLALRGSRATNGVSALHGKVSREMWRDLDIPIGHITNGVHPGAWLAPETEALFDAHLPGWRTRLEDPEFWKRAENIYPDDLLAMQDSRRVRLVREIRRRLGRHVLRESALTVGFARRFAPYKRGNLVFSDPDRLANLLDRGMQLIFAGKAHPNDGWGQDIAADVLRWSRDPRFRRRVVFVPDYDASLGRLLTQGCDVWLNTPQRPREASGTSGQKAALNGNMNCSILDGWWPEAHDGDNGWAIDDGREWEDERARDEHDAEALYHLLGEQILPTFYDPPSWARRMAHALATCVPAYNTHRMVREYVETMYR